MPFMLDYMGSGSGVDGYYTLTLSMETEEPPIDYTPIITDVSENTEVYSGDELYLSISVSQMDVDAENPLVYQWYVADSNDSDGTQINNAHDAIYTVPTEEAKTIYYYCSVTRTVDSIAYTTLSRVITISIINKTESTLTGYSANGFVEDIQIQAYQYTEPGSYIYFNEFEQNNTVYHIALPDLSTTGQFQVMLKTSLTEGLYYTVSAESLDGKTVYTKSRSTAITNEITNVSGTNNFPMFESTFPDGEKRVLKITVHKDGEADTGDVYCFVVNRVPVLSGFSANNGDNALDVTPSTPTGLTQNPSYYFARELQVSAPNAVSITVKGTIKPNVRFELNGNDLTSNFTTDNGVLIDFSDWEESKSGDYYIIPFSLVYSTGANSIKTEYVIKVYVGEGASWEITKQPVGGTYDKGDQIILSVETSASLDDVSYQWQWSKDDNFVGSSDNIPDATLSSLEIPSTIGSTTYYRCIVTDNKTGQSVISNAVQISVNLGHVNAPIIVYQPGVYTIGSSLNLSLYRTEYLVGEKIEPIQMAVGSTESDGNSQVGLARIDVKWYYNTTPTLDGATLLDETNYGKGTRYGEKFDLFGHDNWINVYSYNVTEKLPSGDYYFFFVATAVSNSEDTNTNSITSNFVKIQVKERELLSDFEGSGTESDPYKIKTVADLQKIDAHVLNGDFLAGVVFRFENDITLPADWEPIGENGGGNGVNLLPFSGIIDGNGKTLTVASGGRPLLEYTRDAVVKNLVIFGEEINGAGLLDKVCVDYGPDGEYQELSDPDVITVENVILRKGSKTSGSGIANGGFYSGINNINIINCTVEEGVIIGFNRDQSRIGSFVGTLNGCIKNSVSYATVYGVSAVGGLAGMKGQSMGACEIINSAFMGLIEASGGSVGGIIGAGYISESAPSTPPVTVRNCYVCATITGNSSGGGIGGIVGSEAGLQAPRNNAHISDNHFCGAIIDTNPDAEARYSNVGGILGELFAYDPQYLHYGNNYYLSNSDYSGIGSFKKARVDWNPDQDSFISKTQTEFANGTVTALLNKGSYRNWVQGEKGYPVHTDAAFPISLTIGGDFKTKYVIGESLDMTDAIFTLTYSDDTVKTMTADEIIFTGFDSSEQGVYTVTATYDPVSVSFIVRILLAEPKAVTVSFVLYGDTVHDSSAGTHTLADSNLTEWIARAEYEINENTTVLDVFEDALTKAGLTWVNFDGKYISSITNGAITLAEKDNGANSGWMYTLNGEHPLNGVAEQFLSDGDCILFHYTDDYTKEGGMIGSAVQSMTITTDAPTIEVGEKTDALTVSFTPALLNGNVRCEWSSSDTAIAEVDKNGVVTGIAEGEVTISATAGGKEATVKVTVIPGEVPTVPVESVTIAPESLSLKVGETGNLTATILPENATAQSVQWSSGDDTIASVQNGVVTAVKAGSTTITAEAGGKSSSITVTVEAEAAPDDDPLTAAAKYLYDTVTAPTVGTTGGEWVILGLARSNYSVPDAYFQGYYERLCAVLEENNGILPKSVNSTGTVYTNTEYSRVIVALTAIGKDPTDVAGVNLLLPLEDFETTSGQGINGSIWALIAMDAGQYNVSTREQYIADILAKQLPDGGWNDAGSGTADPDITGMALQALAKYMDRAKVKTAVDKALEVMSRQQNENGGFNSGSTPTSESSAQMLVALCELGISLKDERFVKNGKTVLDNLVTYQNADGSFRHISNGKANQMSTEQALYALVAAYRVENDMTTLYRMTDPQSVDDNPEKIKVTSIELDQSKASISVGGSVKLTATVLPTDAADRTVTWTSSNEDVATVSDGVVTGKSEGEATITAKAGEFTATCIITVTAASSGTEKKTITVSFTLLGDKEHNSDADGQVHGLAKGGLETWIPSKTYTLDEGATVKDLFELALSEAGLSWSNPSGNYVEDITYNGLTLGEFSNGGDSGWMYTLNGVHSLLGVLEQVLANGDVIIWHYTDSYKSESDTSDFGGDSGGSSGSSDSSSTENTEPTVEENTVTVTAEVENGEAKAEVAAEAITEALENAAEEVLTVKVDTEDAESVELTLSAEAVKAAAEGDVDLHIETKQGTVKLDAGTLSELAESGADVAVTVTASEDGSFTLDVTADGETVDAKVKVELPATEDSQVLVIVKEDGTEEVIKKSLVEDGKVYAELPAGATVKVVENEKTFSDVSDADWYAGDVAFAASHELFQGVSETEFAPKDNMTRAMLVTVLFRLEDQPESAGELDFPDVAEDAWYADAVAWASDTGLVNGTDKGFEPNENVSREQIATILYRYVQSLGLVTEAKGDVSKFSDGNEVSDWAKDAMAWAVDVGLFQGDGNKLDPKGDATRGQVAALMQRLVGLLVK